MSLGVNYLRRTIADLANRVSKIVLTAKSVDSNNMNVSITITDFEVTNNGNELIVNTDRIDNITRIVNIKLLDELNNVVIERNPNRNTEGSRSLEFRFEIEVE